MPSVICLYTEFIFYKPGLELRHRNLFPVPAGKAHKRKI